MSKITLQGDVSGTGTLTIAAPNTNTNRTLNLPDTSGDLPVKVGGYLPTSDLGSGTADSTTFLRGDKTWQTISTTPTTAQVLTAYAGAAYLGVGTYAINNQSRSANTTYSGSALGFGSGTWRCMGSAIDDNNSSSGSGITPGYVSLFLRIS